MSFSEGGSPGFLCHGRSQLYIRHSSFAPGHW
jgi:hypothetical protein